MRKLNCQKDKKTYILGWEMGFFYFDESIHERGHFTLGAFVYSEESLDGPVADSLSKCGLMPGVDEFKSGSRMDRRPEQARARNHLNSVVNEHCGIGIVVAPIEPRPSIGIEAIKGLWKILSKVKFRSTSHEAFFDREIFGSSSAGERALLGASFDQPCGFHFEQDSVRVLGLQAADMVAHTCATMLLAKLGIVNKLVKAGGYAGYPEAEIPLEFDLWAGLRYKFFAGPPPPIDTWTSQHDFQVDVESHGLQISEACDETVKHAALARFGKMYLGCIH